ncbi:ATP-binding protein [bacterium]|nr:ATP-binding protein [bacterium]
MPVFYRQYASVFAKKMQSPYVHILFGARQTGKSTLVKSLLPADAKTIDLADPAERARFTASPGLFSEVCRGLRPKEGGAYVFVDEAQTVPAIFDAVQSLYDSDKDRYRFILCGSSARKLRVSGANLLPGRSIRHILHPLVNAEYGSVQNGESGYFPWRGIESRVVFGDLPGIALEADEAIKADLLRTYALSYLEEEIRRETLVKDWGQFLRFLKFAAGGSGEIVNFSSISRESGVGASTVKQYYQLLEDMFVGFTVGAFSGSSRKSALSSPRFFIFDNGVRNAAAGLPLTIDTVNADPGLLFEHWVGCQLWRILSYDGAGRLSYYRTSDGAEVDFVIERDDEVLPIEVKWTDHPSMRDARHLRTFIVEHGSTCRRGIVVSRCPHRLALDENIEGIPWWEIQSAIH